MRVLVIPDIHLKPWMFDQADNLLRHKVAEQAVCLMDIPDDWNKQFDITLYDETFDTAIRFAKAHPKTLWCYGNHDLCYWWHEIETGFSSLASGTVQRKLFELRQSVPENNPICYVQRIDNVLFSHGGISDDFVKAYVSNRSYHNVDAVVNRINELGRISMWHNDSPIWLRPQYENIRMYKPRKLLQIVGHTPVNRIERKGNVISCDVFSTYRDGRPIGTEEFLLLDTKTWEYTGVKG